MSCANCWIRSVATSMKNACGKMSTLLCSDAEDSSSSEKRTDYASFSPFGLRNACFAECFGQKRTLLFVCSRCKPTAAWELCKVARLAAVSPRFAPRNSPGCSNVSILAPLRTDINRGLGLNRERLDLIKSLKSRHEVIAIEVETYLEKVLESRRSSYPAVTT
ncbi:hypothetical protein L596_007808 [Steinernema carpocapsae]|uniref:Uncharacterized protein n=1 Tax=Steinernema carpocapsae TaxID=34508 RepID=A0A4U5PB19_STECR|nr:hypothetical protein L596_007808 [Steinernema carpocapsae]